MSSKLYEIAKLGRATMIGAGALAGGTLVWLLRNRRSV
jgi:hypothetical protein